MSAYALTSSRAVTAADRVTGERVDRRLPVDQLVQLGLERLLDLLGELAAPVGEQLHAVVLVRVVARGDHGTGNALARRRTRPRGGHDAEDGHLHALAREPSAQRRLEHRAGDARVAAHDEAPPTEHPRRRAAEREHQLGREIGVRDPAHAVGPEPQHHANLTGPESSRHHWTWLATVRTQRP